MLTRRRVVVGKIEGVEGTAEAITVADAGILAMDIKTDFDLKVTERAIQLNTMSNLAPVLGAQSGKISFRAELKGSGGASYAVTGPALAVYLKACGFAETLSAPSAIYKPASSGIPSITLWVYEDGIVKKLKGCRGNVKFSGSVGAPCYADFEFTGVWDAVADLAMISPTFEGTVPPALLSSTFTIDAYAGVINNWSIDMANSIGLRESINTATGYVSALLTNRNPSGTIDPEMTTVAAYDWFGKWKTGANCALNLGPVGGTAYNRFTITAPKAIYKKVGEGDRVGMITADVQFNLAMNTGDDELVLTFT